jgi:pimeloyl-ACP methyl ester carboxylesterase
VTYRCDRQVADVEALRRHLGLERVDVLAHSAAGDLALLYAAEHPERVATLTLVAARARAIGVDFTEEHRKEAAALRAAEPWYGPAREAYEAVWAGTATDGDREGIVPFFHGRWDEAAQRHAASAAAQCNEAAAGIYAAARVFTPAATLAALAGLDAPVLVLAGELDGGPRPHVAEAVAGMLPRAELAVQPGGGHFPWLDDPGHFVRTVDRFLTSHRRER